METLTTILLFIQLKLAYVLVIKFAPILSHIPIQKTKWLKFDDLESKSPILTKQLIKKNKRLKEEGEKDREWKEEPLAMGAYSSWYGCSCGGGGKEEEKT